MINSKNFGHWYIVSFRSNNSSLVGGQRCTRLYEFLKKKNLNVNLLTPIGHSSDPNQIKISNPLSSHSLFSRLISLFFPMDDSMLWGIKVNNFLKKKSGGVLITSLPPYGISIIGLLLKKTNNFFWIADFRDPWTISQIFKPVLYLYKMFIANRVEKKLFQRADLILLNTQTDYEDYQKKYPFAAKKCITVRNGFDRIIENRHQKNQEDIIKIVYAGGAYPKGTAVIGIVEWLNKLNQESINFHCDYYGEFHPELNKSKFLTYKGKVPLSEVQKMLSNYKLGFIFQLKEDMKGGRINQKFYDYIASGVQPVVINPSPEIEKHLLKLSIGATIKPKDKPFELVDLLKQIYHSNSSLNKNDLIPYQRDYQFEYLYDFLLLNYFKK